MPTGDASAVPALRSGRGDTARRQHLLRRERLLEERDARFEALRELASAHPRHDHVGDQEVNRGGVLLADEERLPFVVGSIPIPESVTASIITEAMLVVSLTSRADTKVLPADAAGAWFETSTDDRRERVRLTTIDGRGCMAGVSGPPSQLTEQLLDGWPRTLRAAP